MTNINEVYKYRWVLLTSATLACGLTWGIIFSIGVYYVRWVEYFDAGKADVAIIGGINSGSGCLLGPAFGILAQRLGFRTAGAIGGLMMVVGFVGSAFSTNITLLCVFYGFIAGTGSGLCYFCASLAVNCYFTKLRSLAEGVAAMGSGIGGFAFSVLGQYLINEYDWRGAMLITGAIAAHLILLFQLMISPAYLKRFPLLENWKSEDGKHDVGEKSHSRELVDDDEEPSLETNNILDCEDSQSQIAQVQGTWIRRCAVLFKNPLFLLILSADFLCWLAIYVPYIHLPERARLLGVDMDTVAWIASALSIACTFGRPTISALPNIFKWVDVFYLYGFVNGMAGVVTIFSPLLRTEVGLFAYAICYGFLNVCTPLVRASAAKYLGEDTFPLAYSWIIFSNGVALLIGPFLAGLLYDFTLTYDYSFFATGSLLVGSGLLTLLKNRTLRLHYQWSSRLKRRLTFPD